MKIRAIIIIMSLFTIASIYIGSYMYYSFIKEASFEEEEKKAHDRINSMARQIDINISQSRKTAELMSGYREIRDALTMKDASSLKAANATLNFINGSLKSDVCYLLDSRGLTIASSNSIEPDSFIGKNYSFRTYFTDAMNNIPGLLIALGVTSMKRGVYISHPVFAGIGHMPLGVAVIKMSIEEWLLDINKVDEGIILIHDPNGIIVVSNRKDIEYNFLWEPDDATVKSVIQSMLFGKGPFKWSGYKKTGIGSAVDAGGTVFTMHDSELKNYPGSRVVYLQSIDDVKKKISAPLFWTTGIVIVMLCFIIGVAVAYLYKEANFEIKKRISAEEAMQQSLLDKDFLMKEIHHRVKNNLMIVQTLLMLQMNQVDDEKAKSLFMESQHRIRSIGLIHERLYQSSDIRSLNISEYISSLAGELFNTYNVNTSWIKLNLKVDDINLNIDTMIPCGLIINELISNSFKYAFPDNRKGELTVAMGYGDADADADEIIMSVKDNGVGLDEKFDMARAGSMGMQIINSLVHQIHGKIEIIRLDGTEFRITFKEKKSRKNRAGQQA